MFIHLIQTHSQACSLIFQQLIDHIVLIENTDSSAMSQIEICAKSLKNPSSSPYDCVGTLVGFSHVTSMIMCQIEASFLLLPWNGKLWLTMTITSQLNLLLHRRYLSMFFYRSKFWQVAHLNPDFLCVVAALVNINTDFSLVNDFCHNMSCGILTVGWSLFPPGMQCLFATGIDVLVLSSWFFQASV